MRQIVRNPNTDQPIAKATFARVFRRELAEGGARLKQLISSKYYEALHEGRDWAIRAGLRNRFRWTFEGPSPPDPDVIGAVEGDQQLQITFVVPSKKPEDAAIDVTPPAYPADAQPDLSKPAIEPPPQRTTTATGVIHEHRDRQPAQPDPYGHLPKWYPPDRVNNTRGGEGIPPSIFGAKGDPKGWMR
jgi:hypothetical protein